MESTNLYEDDLTEERQPTPAQRDDVAHTQVLDPDVLDTSAEEAGDEEDDDDDDDDEDEDLDDEEDDVD